MDVNLFKKTFNDEDGQALFELIIFLPFMIFFMSLIITMGGSINGSINQQKAARGYFFARVKNNSTIPTPQDLSNSSVTQYMGMSFIGWMEAQQNDVPISPCYKIIPFYPQGNENCIDDYDFTQATTQYVRIRTAFGVCGATYIKDDSTGNFRWGSPPESSSRVSCEMQ